MPSHKQPSKKQNIVLHIDTPTAFMPKAYKTQASLAYLGLFFAELRSAPQQETEFLDFLIQNDTVFSPEQKKIESQSPSDRLG